MPRGVRWTSRRHDLPLRRNRPAASAPRVSPCRARAAGIATGLPRKAPKKAKPFALRHRVNVARRADGSLASRTPADKGLLGRLMLGLAHDRLVRRPAPRPALVAEWRERAARCRHSFRPHSTLRRSYVRGRRGSAEVPRGGRSLERSRAFRPKDPALALMAKAAIILAPRYADGRLRRFPAARKRYMWTAEPGAQGKKKSRDKLHPKPTLKNALPFWSSSSS